MIIIVGLGNPGDKYKNTRHNAGFMAVDALAEKLNLRWEEKKKFKADAAIGGDLILVKPQTYMNESGRSVTSILSYYNLLPKKLGLLKTKNSDLSAVLTVIHDDLDIELGKYKTSSDSRSAGHRGVQSIIDALKTKNFRRLRLGIKTGELEKIPAEKYVLQKFGKEELEVLKKVTNEIVKNY